MGFPWQSLHKKRIGPGTSAARYHVSRTPITSKHGAAAGVVGEVNAEDIHWTRQSGSRRVGTSCIWNIRRVFGWVWVSYDTFIHCKKPLKYRGLTNYRLVILYIFQAAILSIHFRDQFNEFVKTQWETRVFDSHMQYTIIYKCFHVFPGLCFTFKKSGTYAPPNFKRQLRNSLWSETTSSSTPFAKKGSMFFCVQWVWLYKMVQVLDLQEMLVVLSKYRFIVVNCYPRNQTNYWFPILASNIFWCFSNCSAWFY